MIYTDKLPNKCRECPCCNEAYEGSQCNLNIWQNDHAGDDYYNDCDKARHPNCPLILIEQWRLESCATCSQRPCNCTHDAIPTATCEDWQPITSIDNQI